MMCLPKDQKAQISIELIIVFAAVVAAVLLIATNLHKTATSGANKLADTTNKVMEEINAIVKDAH